MHFYSTLSKMQSYVVNAKVHYLLEADNDFLKFNELIGRQLSLEFLHQKYCASCTSECKELYRMGFCKDCFFTKPEAGESIIRPELSRAHQGMEDRSLEFEKAYQLQPHIVYLANSGGLKVGVTREKQKLTRWVDQGAYQAMVFAKTSNRYEAGLIEVDMKNYIADKTAWQQMLKNEDTEVNILAEKKKLRKMLRDDLQHFISNENEITTLEYPVEKYPIKIKSINLDKDLKIDAVLQGIRGQYLILEGGRVLNVRSNTGYRIKVYF